VSGVATLIHNFTGFPVGTGIFLLNIPLFLLGWRSLGRQFGVRSFVGMALLSLFTDLLTFSTPVAKEPLLCAVFGGGLIGAGLALCFQAGGSTGGVDILGKLINEKHPEASLGTVMLITDAVVVTASAVLNGLLVGLYSLITVFVSTRTMDYLQDGYRSAQAYCVISAKNEEITHAVTRKLARGATLLEGRGGWTGNESTVLLCLVQRQDVAQLRQIIRETDPRAFVFVLPASEVMGEGFSIKN
jgi:uncharacterized membrane-anchored protein YitT (DUF2179 family)